MKPETIKVLYEVEDNLKDLRKLLDKHMYHSGGIPAEDMKVCRKVYDAICRVPL